MLLQMMVVRAKQVMLHLSMSLKQPRPKRPPPLHPRKPQQQPQQKRRKRKGRFRKLHAVFCSNPSS
jgi:hypothetical protein